MEEATSDTVVFRNVDGSPGGLAYTVFENSSGFSITKVDVNNYTFTLWINSNCYRKSRRNDSNSRTCYINTIMAYTLTNLQDDIRNYTEVDSGVLSNSVLNTMIKNAENRIYRDVDSDDNRFYATSNLQAGNRYVTIPSDLRFIRYVQLKDSSGNQVFLEKRDTSFMAEYYNTPATQSGLPKYYGNWDANFWVVAPTPNSTYLNYFGLYKTAN